MKHFLLQSIVLCLASVSFGAEPASSPNVALTEKSDSVVLSNGIVTVEIGKRTGNPLALLYRNQSLLASPGYLNWHAESGEGSEDADGKKDNNATFTKIVSGECRVVAEPGQNGGELAEICVAQKFGGQGAPFDVELHYILRRGDSGYYSYVVFHHPGDYPAGQLGDARMLYRLNDHVFDYLTIDDARRRLVPPPGTPNKPLGPKESLLITDGPFKGTVEDKYHNFADAGDHFLHGWEGSKSGLGCWILYGSTEDQNGGPTKQHNNGHFERILMKTLTCGHYGAAPVQIGAGESWEKVYGPFMVYVNSGADVDALWSDAKEKAAAERAAWPYPWLQRQPLYPGAAARGGVSGQLRLKDSQDVSASPAGAWVGLAAPKPDWQQQSAGYQYWVHADQTGRFAIRNVRPGSYTLYAFVDGVMDQYHSEGVTVAAGRTAELSLPDWQPPHHGKQLWQIGTPDRTAKEFRHGDDYRQWGLWNKFPEDFPEGVNFVISKSQVHTDWNYAQCCVLKDGAWEGTNWNILFDLPDPPNRGGVATLRIALAASHKAALRVYVNGKLAGSRNFDTDNALTRAGIHGQYSQWDVPFDASLFKPGRNTIVLQQASGHSPQKNVMYDCLRLEVATNNEAPNSR